MMTTSNRRHVMKTSSSAIAGAAILSSCEAGITETREDKVRVGIIGRTGKGNYGHDVDLAFTKIPLVEIKAVADESESGRLAAQKRVGASKSYADYREMLEKEQLDLVAICPRWIDQHHAMIVAAARAGCHVYMEKPFCRTLAECDDAIAKLNEKKLKLGIAHISQYSPVLDVVRALLKEGAIGNVLEMRARGKEDRRGGGEDLWVLGSHVLAIMRRLMGESPIDCSANVLVAGKRASKSDVIEGAEGIGPLVGDELYATYTFANGVRGYFASKKDMASNPSRFAVQIFGSKGVIEVESDYLSKAYLLRDGGWSPGRSGKNWETITSAGVGKPEPRNDGNYQGGHIAAINDLIECTRSGGSPKCSADDARAVIEMIAGVFESHRVGGRVEFPLRNRDNPVAQFVS